MTSIVNPDLAQLSTSLTQLNDELKVVRALVQRNSDRTNQQENEIAKLKETKGLPADFVELSVHKVPREQTLDELHTAVPSEKQSITVAELTTHAAAQSERLQLLEESFKGLQDQMQQIQHELLDRSAQASDKRDVDLPRTVDAGLQQHSQDPDPLVISSSTPSEQAKHCSSQMGAECLPECDGSRQMLDLFEKRMKYSYKLKESVWDAGIFLGLSELGIQSSVFLAIGMILNILVQGVFCVICWSALANPDIEEDNLFYLNIWRWNSAHDVANVNTIWPVSLASRLCEGDASLPLSGQQAALYDFIQLYQPLNFEFVGELMCVLCLICFWTSLWRDCKETIHFGRSIISAHGISTIINPADGFVQLESLSLLRSVIAWIIIFLRFTVFANLGIVGTTWLAGTTSVGDLLVDALALELVLNVDELLYAGLVPVRVKAFVKKCVPLRAWQTRRSCCIDVEALAGMLLVFAFLPVVYFWQIRHMASLVKQAREVLCGGPKNFAYGLDPLGVVYVHNGMPSLQDANFTEDTFDRRDPRIMALQEVRAGVPREEWNYAVYTPSIDQLKLKISNPVVLAIDEINDGCKDILTTENCAEGGNCLQYRESWRYMTSNMSLQWCLSAEPYCYGHSRSAVLTRTLCPDTCGCNSHTRGTFLLGSASIAGCPQMCYSMIHSKQIPFESMTDCPNEVYANHSVWKRFLSEAKPVLEDAVSASLEKQGCLALTYHSYGLELCAGRGVGNGLKPLSPLCPDSCGCSPDYDQTAFAVSIIGYCPPACTCHNQNDLSTMASCASSKCKESAVSKGYVEFLGRGFTRYFPVKSINDVNDVCSCQALLTPGDRTHLNDYRSVHNIICDNQCYGAASVILGYSYYSKLIDTRTVKLHCPIRPTVVVMLYKVNLDYNKITSTTHLPIMENFIEACKQGISKSTGGSVTKNHIIITLSSGSVKVHAEITVPVGQTVMTIQTVLDSLNHDELESHMASVPNIASVLIDGMLSLAFTETPTTIVTNSSTIHCSEYYCSSFGPGTHKTLDIECICQDI